MPTDAQARLTRMLTQAAWEGMPGDVKALPMTAQMAYITGIVTAALRVVGLTA